MTEWTCLSRDKVTLSQWAVCLLLDHTAVIILSKGPTGLSWLRTTSPQKSSQHPLREVWAEVGQQMGEAASGPEGSIIGLLSSPSVVSGTGSIYSPAMSPELRLQEF